MGEKALIFGKKRANSDDDDRDDDEDVVDGAAVFSSPWLPSKDHKYVFFFKTYCSFFRFRGAKWLGQLSGRNESFLATG